MPPKKRKISSSKTNSVDDVKRPRSSRSRRQASKEHLTNQCDFCKEYFETNEELLEHVKDHIDDDDVIMCTNCSAVFTSEEEIIEHIKHPCDSKEGSSNDKGTTIYSCSYCEKLFQNETFLNTHMKRHVNGKLFKCLHCNVEFDDKEIIKKHQVAINNADNSCSCKKKFCSPDILLEHFNVDHSSENVVRKKRNNEIYLCETCFSFMPSKSDLDKHVLNHRKMEDLKSTSTKDADNNTNASENPSSSNINIAYKDQDGTGDNPSLDQLTESLEPDVVDLVNDSSNQSTHKQPSNIEDDSNVHKSEENKKSFPSNHPKGYLDNFLKFINENNSPPSKSNDAANIKDSFEAEQVSVEEETDAEDAYLRVIGEEDYLDSDEDITNEETDDKQNEIIVSGTKHSRVSGKDEEVVKKYGTLEETSEAAFIGNIEHTEYYCEICSQACKPYKAYLSHMNNHKDKKKEFKCSLCFEKFITQRCLAYHEKMHVGKSGAYRCKFCSKSFSYKFSLDHHIMKRHEGQFICPVCNVKFPLLRSLKTHMYVHSNTLHECKQCNKVFGTFLALDRHMQYHMKSVLEAEYNCDLCTKTSHKFESYERHMEKHKEPKTIDCSKCKQKFNSQKHLEYHQQRHLLFEFACDKCFKFFRKEKELQEHLLIHNVDNDTLCSICDNTFESQAYLKQHVNNEHQDVKNQLCTMCGQTISTPWSFHEHLLSHRLLESKNEENQETESTVLAPKPEIQCEICFEKFTEYDSFKDHMESHEGDKSHQCDVCGENFLTKTCLDQHLITHNDKFEFKCIFCDKYFNNMAEYTYHYQVHTNDTDLTCPFCRKLFPNRHRLSVHICSGKKKNKLYQCKICSRYFSVHGHLKKHMKTSHDIEEKQNTKPTKEVILSAEEEDISLNETDENPSTILYNGEVYEINKCKYCQQYFSTKKHLEKHIQDNH